MSTHNYLGVNMVNMRMFFFSCIIGTGLIATSCSSNEEISTNENKGFVQLSVKTDATFSTVATRAVNEESYKDVNNYRIQILNSSDNKTVKDYASLSEVPDKIELNNGSYTLKAFYGTESNASRESFYVEGVSTFAIQGEAQSITVDCAPVCGKVIANFAPEMDNYFSDYSIVYETKALTAEGKEAAWTKDDTDPWYLKVDKAGEEVKATIHFTRKSDDKSSTAVSTYTLAPNKSWTLKIAPQDNNGSLGIIITIDESTDDKEIDIVVPSDWV